jgi:hypothetical protein
MVLRARKGAVNSVYCDCDSHFLSADLYEVNGFKMPDDFELGNSGSVGTTRFQVIRDLKNGWCFYNHDGNLYPFTKTRILFRDYKIKQSVVEERFGEHNPFHTDSIWFFETGFNYGSIEFMIFCYPYKKNEMPLIASYRKILYRFPLFWLMNEVLILKEQEKKKAFSLERTRSLEYEKIIRHEMLQGWQHTGRDTSPSEDQYSERVDFPLHDYSFNRDDRVSIWLHFEFF